MNICSTCDNKEPGVPHSDECSKARWKVVDRNRHTLWEGMYSKDNAQDEADRLNHEGWPEGKPYRVVRDLVTESLQP